MNITFWPHIWAIPLTILVGVGIGWVLRSKMEEPPRHRPIPPDDDA